MPNTWYVNKSGSASNGGTSPLDAFDTVNAGITAASDGDAIIIENTSGSLETYTEDVVLSKSGIRLYATGGPEFCRIRASTASAISFDMDGADFCLIENIAFTSAVSHTGQVLRVLNCEGTKMRNCRVSPDTTGVPWLLQGSDNCQFEHFIIQVTAASSVNIIQVQSGTFYTFDDIRIDGGGVNTTGFKYTTASQGSVVRQLIIDDVTTGILTAAATSGNLFVDSVVTNCTNAISDSGTANIYRNVLLAGNTNDFTTTSTTRVVRSFGELTDETIATLNNMMDDFSMARRPD